MLGRFSPLSLWSILQNLSLELILLSIYHCWSIFWPWCPHSILSHSIRWIILSLKLVYSDLGLVFLVHRVQHRGFWKLARRNIGSYQQRPLEICRVLPFEGFMVVVWSYILLGLVWTHVTFVPFNFYVSFSPWNWKLSWRHSFSHCLRPNPQIHRLRAHIRWIYSLAVYRISANESRLRPFAIQYSSLTSPPFSGRHFMVKRSNSKLRFFPLIVDLWFLNRLLHIDNNWLLVARGADYRFGATPLKGTILLMHNM